MIDATTIIVTNNMVMVTDEATAAIGVGLFSALITYLNVNDREMVLPYTEVHLDILIVGVLILGGHWQCFHKLEFECKIHIHCHLLVHWYK